jgi:hypothetical protein
VEFSRFDQFQGMLVGMAVADAAAYGHIPALKPLQQIDLNRASDSTHWGTALVQVANQVTHPATTPITDRPNLGPDVSGTAIALIHMPILLRHLDTPAEQYWRATQQYGVANNGESLSTALYQLLQVILKHHPHQSGATRFAQLHAEFNHRSQAQGNALLASALEHTLAATGDFRLAIASSLPTATSPFLPVLIGLLCTALRGLKTIPVKWRQELASPVAPAGQAVTSYWQRWELANEGDLRAVATALWRTWAGL